MLIDYMKHTGGWDMSMGRVFICNSNHDLWVLSSPNGAHHASSDPQTVEVFIHSDEEPPHAITDDSTVSKVLHAHNMWLLNRRSAPNEYAAREVAITLMKDAEKKFPNYLKGKYGISSAVAAPATYDYDESWNKIDIFIMKTFDAGPEGRPVQNKVAGRSSWTQKYVAYNKHISPLVMYNKSYRKWEHWWDVSKHKFNRWWSENQTESDFASVIMSTPVVGGEEINGRFYDDRSPEEIQSIGLQPWEFKITGVERK
jgi:hypothetical protein